MTKGERNGKIASPLKEAAEWSGRKAKLEKEVIEKRITKIIDEPANEDEWSFFETPGRS